MSGYKDTHGDKLIVVDVHGGDYLETPHTNYLSNAQLRYNMTGYPGAVIDRLKSANYGSGTWEAKINTALTDIAKLGIKLETTIDSDGKLDIIAKVISNEAISNAYLTLYLVEDDVAQSAGGQSDYANPGIVDANYKHQHVLRRVIHTNPHGQELNINETRVEYSKEHNDIDISAYNAAKLKIVAIVNEQVFNADLLKAYNAKQVKAGESTDWN